MNDAKYPDWDGARRSALLFQKMYRPWMWCAFICGLAIPAFGLPLHENWSLPGFGAFFIITAFGSVWTAIEKKSLSSQGVPKA